MKQKFVTPIEALCASVITLHENYDSLAEEKAVFLVLSTLDKLRRRVFFGK